MKSSRVVIPGSSAVVLVTFVAVIIGAPQTPAPPPAPPLVDATHLIMQPEAASTGGRVMGDASKPGLYVTRARFAPGRGSRPHFHSQDRYVTVIKGTWWTGAGDVYKPETMVAIKPGGFMFHPAGFHHYDQARDEEVIVQIIGMGPVQTVQTEVDENGQSVNRGSGAGRGAAQPAGR